MPHSRKRYLEPLLRKALSFSPLVGVLGHRQVGKTTLLNEVCRSYHTLDKASERAEAEKDPEAYLKTRAGKFVALDECQNTPKLFPELKEWVRVHKQPGQFVLSGSVRFSGRELIKESLTGRIINLELLPFTVSELLSRELPTLLPTLMGPGGMNLSLREVERLLESRPARTKAIDLYLKCGGLPGVCFVRDSKLRALKIEEQLNTILDRDLRMIRKTSLSLSDIKRLLAVLVINQAEPLDYTFLQKETQISVPTIKRLIYAFEALFLLRTLPIEGSVKGHAVFFEDVAEANVLAKSIRRSELDLLIHFCFTQLRAPFHYQIGNSTEIFQYRTRSGVIVPLAFRNPDAVLGVIPMASSERLDKSRAAAHSFLRTYANSRVILTHSEAGTARALSDRIFIVPVNALV